MDREGINVLSLFDGISCGRVALERAGFRVNRYIASEVDKYAIQIAGRNYPDTEFIGDVTQVRGEYYRGIDLLIGGSPCQGFSYAGKQLNFDDPRSKLFFEFVRVMRESKPRYFLLENVPMKQEYQDVISAYMGVEPIEIDAALFSAQRRRRLYWTNIPLKSIDSASDRCIADILTSDYSEKTVKDTALNLRHERKLTDKSLTCTATMWKGAGNNGMTLVRRPKQSELSVLNVNEVEALMTLPKDYTMGVSKTQRLKMLGNGWVVDAVRHIFGGMHESDSGKEGINVLSTFNGLGSIWIILDRLGIKVSKRYSSETDKFANSINDRNYPDTIQVGDVTKLRGEDFDEIDLLVGGSPCQGFSMAGKRLNFDDPRSKLFFEFARLLEELKPRYFLLENVKMKQEYQDIISEYLGVKPVKINSALFSAQSRVRLYWTNLPIGELPKSNTEVIADIIGVTPVGERQERIVMTKSDFKVSVRKHYIDKRKLCLFLREHRDGKTLSQISDFTGAPKTMVEHWFRLDGSFSVPQVGHWDKLKECLEIDDNRYDKAVTEFEVKNNSFDMAKRIYHIDGKHPTLTTLTGGGQRKTITDGDDLFLLTPEHCEKLQNVPCGYTEGVSDRQRFKMLGNGWECKTVEFILSGLVMKLKEEQS